MFLQHLGLDKSISLKIYYKHMLITFQVFIASGNKDNVEWVMCYLFFSDELNLLILPS
jgi:hypothetical protein